MNEQETIKKNKFNKDFEVALAKGLILGLVLAGMFYLVIQIFR